MIIYFDLDGVLTDYDGQLAAENNLTREQVVLDRELRRSLENTRKTRMGLDHYRTLKPHNLLGFKSLMRSLFSLGHTQEILTSYGDVQPLETGVIAHTGKQAWLKQHYADIFEEGVISRFNGVVSCSQKRFYGRPGSFLIDDQEDNIRDFAANGGSVFHYTYGVDPHSILEFISGGSR